MAKSKRQKKMVRRRWSWKISPWCISYQITVTLLESCKYKCVSENGLFQPKWTQALAAKTPVKISSVRKVHSREDSLKVDVLVNTKYRLHFILVRSLAFQHHADYDWWWKQTLAEILHILEKQGFVYYCNTQVLTAMLNVELLYKL